MAEKKLKTLQFEGLNTTYVLPEVDPTSSISGDAADAKIVGDHLTDNNNPHGITLEQLGASKTIVTDENQDGHITLKSYLSDSGSGNISTHISDRSNPHRVTAAQVGADVSGAAKQALEDAKGYTDEVITNLIGGAPETLNTLQELAEAMEANAEVADVLEKAIADKADNSALTAHIDNKSNPHNVTIEQIGAAPAGFGLGLTGSHLAALADANEAQRNGWYLINKETVNGIGTNAIMRVESEAWAHCVQTAYGASYSASRPRIQQRVKCNGVWSTWVDCDPAAFAPAGYGLGGKSAEPETEDLNDATACGWYAFTSDTLNRPFNYGSVMVSNRYGNQVTQMAFNPRMGSYGEICIRHFYDGSWNEWEYINPPMTAGVEYRTIERVDNKAVYKKKDFNGQIMYRLDGSSTWTEGLPGAAPSGYVVGHYTAVTNAEIDAAVANMYAATPDNSQRFYKLYVNANGLDITSGSYFVTVQRTDADWGNIYCSQYSYYGMTVTRCKYGGAWQPWEWVNPPMQLGVEYRTTERWNGNVVYKKLIHCGKGPAGGALNLFPNTGTNSVFIDASCKARSNSGWSYFLDHFLTLGEYGSGDCVIALNAAKDLSAYDIYLEVKYYKA